MGLLTNQHPLNSFTDTSYSQLLLLLLRSVLVMNGKLITPKKTPWRYRPMDRDLPHDALPRQRTRLSLNHRSYVVGILYTPSYFDPDTVHKTSTMPESIIDEPTVALDRYDGNIFVITMRKAPENRLNSEYAQKLISIFNEIRRILGTSTEGAVITKGNDAKFWCTVSRT